MSIEQQIQEALAFVDTCVQLEFLDAANAESLKQCVVDEQYLVPQEAVRRGWLSPSEVEIVQSLLRPSDVVPGYEILELVGRGGMGVVYRARQLDLDRVVALKTILINSLSGDTTAARFEREAKALARLQHPNIVQALNFGQHHGRYYFAMEFVQGDTCEQLVEKRGHLDPTEVWQIVRQVASGLLHAQRQGLIHRDIKPANLILMPPPEGTVGSAGDVGIVKITDFGLAMFTEHDADKMKLTTGDKIMGSPAFMSPEQFGGNAVDFRSDIYSLGATAWNLMFGKPPFQGGSVAMLYQQKLRPMVIDDELAVDLPPDQWQLLMGMMDPNPELRPDSYDVLIEAIDQLGLTETGRGSGKLSFVDGDSSSISFSEQPTVTLSPAGLNPSVPENASGTAANKSVSRADVSEAATQQLSSASLVTAGVASQFGGDEKGTDKLSMESTATYPALRPVEAKRLDSPTFAIGPDAETRQRAADGKSANKRIRWKLPAMIVLAIACVLFGLMLWPEARGPRDYRQVLSTRPLYDGVTLAGWDVGGSMIGAWNIVEAPDASTAIACTTRQGAVTRPLPNVAHARVSLFVWLQPDSGFVDIDFGFAADQMLSPRGCLRLDATQIELGIKYEDFAPMEQIEQKPSPLSMLDRYHVIYLEKQGSDWYVFLEEMLIGTIPIASIAEGDAIRFVVHGSRETPLGEPGVYFSDVQLSELAKGA